MIRKGSETMKSVKGVTPKQLLLLLGGVLAVVICVVAVTRTQAPETTGLELDDNATMGILPGIDVEQRQLELQEILDESMIAFSVNTSPVFESGRSAGNLMLENPENNAKLLVAEIYVDEGNELVYTSKAIAPGSYIENVTLDKVLEPGDYPATVYFKAYRESDESFIGQSGAAITISVLS